MLFQGKGMGWTPSNHKVPPGYAPANEASYSFKDWVQDVNLWSLSTDILEAAKAPLLVLQLGGLARELAREIPTDTLQAGAIQDQNDGQGAIHRTGLSVLIYGLSRRFAPLTVEQTIRSMTALVAFKRRPGEPIDQALARFDLLRHRAANEGNYDPGPAASSWMLLNALGIPPAQWAQFLAPSGGPLPTTPMEVNNMLTLIRRQGHLYESQGLPSAASSSHRAAYNMVDGTWSSGAPTQSFHSSQGTSSEGFGFPSNDGDWIPQSPSFFQNSPSFLADVGVTAGNTTAHEHSQYYQCSGCSVAFPVTDADAEEYNSTDTSDDNDKIDFSDAPLLPDGNIDGGELLHAYQVARRRWRSFVGKKPRRFRRKGHGKGKKGGKHGKKSGWSFPVEGWYCPACQQADSQFAGKSSNKGKGSSKGNPRGANGQRLVCDNCGSDQHLWRNCTAPNASSYKAMRMSQGGGKGSFLTGAASSTAAAATGVNGFASAWEDITGQVSRHVFFNVSLNQRDNSDTDIPIQYQSDTLARWYEEEQKEPVTPQDPWHETPSSDPWSTHISPMNSPNKHLDFPVAPRILEGVDEGTSDLLGNRSLQGQGRCAVDAPLGAAKMPPLPRHDRGHLPSYTPNVAIPDLSSMIVSDPATSTNTGVSNTTAPRYQWFGPSYHRYQDNTSDEQLQLAFLQATRLSENREGLLIDPGAFDNLTGSRWVERMVKLSKINCGMKISIFSF